jgi:hypothetical protein
MLAITRPSSRSKRGYEITRRADLAIVECIDAVCTLVPVEQ